MTSVILPLACWALVLFTMLMNRRLNAASDRTLNLLLDDVRRQLGRLQAAQQAIRDVHSGKFPPGTTFIAVEPGYYMVAHLDGTIHTVQVDTSDGAK